MIRIVGVQRNECPNEEFVLFQNQGALRECLRGHVVLSDAALECCENLNLSHVFREDELVPSGMYVILYSGHGKSRWARTKDNALVFFAYMGRNESVWAKCPGPLHLLVKQHSYVNRNVSLMAS